MQRMIRKSIVFIGFLFWSAAFLAQETDAKWVRKMRPVFLKLSVGLNNSSFRDFATSPLFYSGSSVYGEVGYLKKDAGREVDFGINYSLGRNTSIVKTNGASSLIHTLSGYYSRLYKINSWSDSTWNFKAGAMLNITGNYRYNPSLQNNGEGMEIIGNLLGSMQVERDLSRMETKHKKFLFIKYNLHPRQMELGFRLNVGWINSSYRNGFVYSGQSSIINEFKAFDRYEFSMFSGFRMSSALAYTLHLDNENALRFSYVWDAYKTGGDFDSFEMAS